MRVINGHKAFELSQLYFLDIINCYFLTNISEIVHAQAEKKVSNELMQVAIEFFARSLPFLHNNDVSRSLFVLINFYFAFLFQLLTRETLESSLFALWSGKKLIKF